MKSVLYLTIWLSLKFMISAQSQTTKHRLSSTVNNSGEPTVEINETVKEIYGQNRDGVVVTNSGPVQGYIHQETPNIKRFYDIPYGSFTAENPFEKPSPSEPWEKVHDEREHKSRCPQIGYSDEFVGDTDCLTLNIMTPTITTNGAVLFHIHDGSYNKGSGNPSIYGPEYIVPKGIILVLPNYRLGPLGFLCMQNMTIPGNAALKDLTLALKWVKENIAAFGGNPSNIVVSGEGSAGALAGYLAVSPSSSDYVSKVIAESGFVLSYWAIDRDPLSKVKLLSEKLHSTIQTVTSKSNKLTAKKLTEFSIIALVSAAKDIKFAPCIENGNKSFLTETPWNMLLNLKTNISYMIGSTNHAGMREAMQHTEKSLSELNNDFGVILPNDLDFKENKEKRSEIGNRIRAQYFGDEKVTFDAIGDLSFCYTDASYLGPMIRAARPLVAAGASVYFYEFAFVGNLNQEITSSVKIDGASRGDTARYIFSQDGRIPDDDTKEKHMVNITTELWERFIHTGKPTSENIEWHRLEQTSESNESWLLIGSEVKPQKGLHVDRLKLWTEIYETYFVERNRASGFTPFIYSLIFTLFLFIYVSKLLV